MRSEYKSDARSLDEVSFVASKRVSVSENDQVCKILGIFDSACLDACLLPSSVFRLYLCVSLSGTPKEKQRRGEVESGWNGLGPQASVFSLMYFYFG